MIFFKRKKPVDDRRRDLALGTAERRKSQAQLKERVSKLLAAKDSTGLTPAKG